MSTELVDSILSTMPPGDLLRSVAARMRELADGASPGTWNHMCMGSEGCRIFNDGRLRDRRHIAFFGSKQWQADHADAGYVTAMEQEIYGRTFRHDGAPDTGGFVIVGSKAALDAEMDALVAECERRHEPTTFETLQKERLRRQERQRQARAGTCDRGYHVYALGEPGCVVCDGRDGDPWSNW